MKIDYVCDDKFIVYLNKLYYSFDKSTIDVCLGKIIKRLKKKYDIEIYSNFNVECYINDNYGIILVIKKEYDPFSLYSKKTNINIKFYKDALFLYEIDDYFLKEKFKESSIYIYKNKLYIDIKNSNIFYILEHIKSILFGNNALKAKELSKTII